MISNFSDTIEFPAGLMDAGETCEECALRELKEETGYTGVISTFFNKTITLVSDCGMSAADMIMVTVDVIMM